MSEQQQSYTTITTTQPLKVEYIDDKPDMRQWLMDLRRDLLRKVKQIDEMLMSMPAQD